MEKWNPEVLNDHLANFSYIGEYSPCGSDWTVYRKFASETVNPIKYPHFHRWLNHMKILEEKSISLSDTFEASLLNGVCKMSPSGVEETGDASLSQNLLYHLEKYHQFNTFEYATTNGEDHQKIVGAVKSLKAVEELVETEEKVSKTFELTAEGNEMVENGSHEARVFFSVGPNGIDQTELMKLPFGKVGISKAIASGWIAVDKTTGTVRLVQKVETINDNVQNALKMISEGNMEKLDTKTLTELKKRKLLTEINIKSYLVKKGLSFSTVLNKPVVDLTADMIINNSWQKKRFKKYNFDALGMIPSSGHLHPLMKVRNEFRQIFLQMGFVEMPTNRYVESSFWNFDALFQPQQHPARDSHDTFFLSDPEKSSNFPEDYLHRVKKVHSEGGYGSKGYNYDWKLEEAQKNVLRTHTTAVSAHQLYELAKKGFNATKMFSIDRVFRNETVDATHLAEFHQVEGVVAEKNLTLAHVMGLFTEFFRKCGITNLRFKPTYNPYTEPSMEIFAFHEGLGKWVEIGNSGMFRPEMLLPMGLPPDVNVAGYGLSLERPTMIRYGIDNIRDLFGPKRKDGYTGMLSTLMRWTCEISRKSPRLVLFQPVRSRFGLNRKAKYRRRTDEFKENIEQSKKKLPYQEDMIPLRPSKDLCKAFGFTVGVGVISFALAAVYDLKRSNNRWREIYEVVNVKYNETKNHFSKYHRLRDGVKCTFVLVGINMIVMLMWGIKSWQLFMWRWFTNSFASKALCLPMVLSAFSHANMLHLVLNMYVLNTFAPVSIDSFLGIEQFWAFYITAAAVSSLAGITHKCIIRTNRRALGASGAIMALLVYTCMKLPEARLKIVFVPHFDFSAKSAVSGMIAFDLICLLLGFKMFDHAAHLGGSLFGLFYGMYGQHLIWKKYGDGILKLCGLNAEKRRDVERSRRSRSTPPRRS
ncbi:Phenylalanine--tRNA ligase alpha subunit [Dirofilaria immitis]